MKRLVFLLFLGFAFALLTLAFSPLVPGSAPAAAMIQAQVTTSPAAPTPAPTQGATTAPPPSPTAPVTGTVTAACTNHAQFVADVTIPDGSPMTPGEAFNKTWRLRNTGTCTWGEGYRLAFLHGTTLASAKTVVIPTTTGPGATVDVQVAMSAPTTSGNFTSTWQLEAPNGGAFGDRVWATVRVLGSPAAAPPLVVSNSNMDDPAKALTIGSRMPSLAPNTAVWIRFDYTTVGNTLPRPTVDIRLVNGVQNGLTFEVWSPERMQTNWTDNKPVGRGTPLTVDCNTNQPPSGGTLPNPSPEEPSTGVINKCSSNDLTWTGGFGLEGRYYVRIVNPGTQAVTPQIEIAGDGLVR